MRFFASHVLSDGQLGVDPVRALGRRIVDELAVRRAGLRLVVDPRAQAVPQAREAFVRDVERGFRIRQRAGRRKERDAGRGQLMRNRRSTSAGSAAVIAQTAPNAVGRRMP